ncbi:MAG: hypothetical protein NVS3B21_36100 [Acidimicrobiales bacterium]
MADTLIVPDLDRAPVLDETDADDTPDAAHIVTQRDLMHSQLTGEAIRALCGKMWVPKRNPDDFPICMACTDIFNASAGGGPS